MSVHKQITECFKMKKPRPSPAKDPARKDTVTPKRRGARKRLAQGRAPGVKTTCGEDAIEENARECEVDYSARDPDLWLCSQDVPVSDIGWDYSSPRNKVMQVKKRDESDLANVMKLFRHGPAESEPNSGAWDIFKNDVIPPASSTKAAGDEARKKQEKAAPNPEVLFERMQGLLQLIQETKNGDSDVTESLKHKNGENKPEDTTGARVAAKNCCRGLLINREDDTDGGSWAEGDESILVAASQEAEMVGSPLRPPKKMGSIEEEGVSLMFVSPLRRGTKAKSPRLRKSPRIQCLTANRRSPIQRPVGTTVLASPVPKATERTKTPNRQRCRNAAENTNQSFTDIMDTLLTNDDDDNLLDWVCSTYEQALQQQDAKKDIDSTTNTTAALPQQNSSTSRQAASAPFTVTNATRCSARLSGQAEKSATPTARNGGPRGKPGQTTSKQSVINQNAKKVDSHQKSRLENGARSTILKAASPLSRSGAGWEEDDDDFTTPDVMSWLEKVESQTTKNKCTPEEIERKRQEALLRRQQRHQQQQHWKGRLRTSR
ncbi:uncharacterized protein LOC135398152 [Ornithodoros turicata]|uniref:uncharacterized protein LOC135398152 n=1 Tax=Ornithodoros turicata TaxID=34597 RepID=UPI0031390936